MRMGCLLLLVLCFVSPSLTVQAQDKTNGQQEDEDDIRVRSVEARQQAAANLLALGSRLRDAGDIVEAARALNRAGRFQLLLNEPDDAIATYEEARQILKQTSNTHVLIDSINGLATAYKRVSRCSEAKPLLSRATSLSVKIGYVEGEAESFLISSDCQNDKSLALQTAQRSFELWKSINHKLGMARACLVLGEYQMVQNMLAESTQSFQTALQLWRELDVPHQVAEALINLGFIEYHKGAWQASLSFYIEAQQLIDEKAEPYMMGQITAGLAEAFLESGLPETGLEKYRESLEYHRQTKTPIDRIGIEWGIGRAHYLLRNYSEAIAILSTARSEAESHEAFMIVALCDDFLGRTRYAMGEYPEALQHYQTALSGFIKAGNPMEAARTIALMGQVYQQQGNFQKAHSYYQRALTSFRALSDQVNESAALYALGSLELKQNQVDAAESHLRESIQVTEEMRRVSTSVDLTAAFSARVHERYEKYIDCMMRKHQSLLTDDIAIRAFQTSEVARARALTELLRATEAKPFPGLDQQIILREKNIRESLQAIENAKVALLSKKYKTEDLANLEEEHKRLKAEHDRVSEEIQARSSTYNQVMRPSSWDLQRIQDKVIADDQTALLEYSLGAEKSYLWVVKRHSIKSYELPNEEQIIKVATRVYDLLSTVPTTNNGNQLNAALSDLAQMILTPAIDQLNCRRIIVVADGVLNFIPFQILPSGLNNEPLVSQMEIINAPSASILGELQQEALRRPHATKLLAAFGDPVFAPQISQGDKSSQTGQMMATARWRSALRDSDRDDVGRLFYAKREIESLRAVAGGDILIATEYDATRERLLGTDLTQYAMLHFVTHGFFDPKHPENSGLLLSTINHENKRVDGFVGLHEIYELRAPVLLVVLSACQTALGKDVRGEGLVGMTRGFMYAGASSVVASLWQVDDAATAELMRLFYSNMLQQGMKPGEALRAAQNSVRQQPQWRSPYYWAAFTLQGEYRQQITRPGLPVGGLTVRWQILIFTALILSIAGIITYLRARRTRQS